MKLKFLLSLLIFNSFTLNSFIVHNKTSLKNLAIKFHSKYYNGPASGSVLNFNEDGKCQAIRYDILTKIIILQDKKELCTIKFELRDSLKDNDEIEIVPIIENNQEVGFYVKNLKTNKSIGMTLYK